MIALARMGDLVQCFPAMSDLNRRAGGEGIALMVQKELEPLARMHPAVRDLILFDGDVLLDMLKNGAEWSPSNFASLSELFEKINSLKPHLIVNLTHTAFSGMLTYLLKSPDVHGRSYHPGAGSALLGDWTKYFFTLLSSRSCNGFNLVDLHREISAGVRGETDRLLMPQTSQRYAEECLRALPGKYRIALGLGANHALRRWPQDCWHKLITLLADREDVGFLLLGDSGESQDAAEIRANMGDRCLDLCGQTDLPRLMALLDHCHLYIGNDSGPLHLAAGLGVPCVGIYLAMASAWETAPYRPGAVSIEPDVSCHPCSEKGGCTDARCHHQVQPDAVARIALTVLHEERPGPESGCIVRISEFDDDGWLTLAGQKKSGDDLRLAWREILKAILKHGTESDNPRRSAIFSHNATSALAVQVERMEKNVLQLCQRTIEEVKNSSQRGNGRDADALTRGMPALLAGFPEFRPLFDLYRLDCLNSDSPPPASPVENVLIAQEKLLRRMGQIRVGMLLEKASKVGTEEASAAVFA